MAERPKMIDMGKIVFATFADSRYGKAIERIKKETENFGFDERYFFLRETYQRIFSKDLARKYTVEDMDTGFGNHIL